MSNRSVTYTLNLNNRAIQSIKDTESAALRLDGVMHSVNNTMHMFGLGFAGAAIVSGAKEWIQAAADYESAMISIKNVSKDAADGVKNQLFINDEVTKFKIDLQSSTDAYRDFLTKLGGTDLAADKIRKLHDEVLMISKVTATPTYKMDAAVRDMGIMLGEGVLEARHLRALSYVFPQITKYLADELGLKDNEHGTSRQQLAHLISSGKLTKLALNSEVLLSAVEKYAKSLEGGLDESLNSTQSAIHVLHNDWVRFKNDFVLDNKTEIIDFFENLSAGIGFLREHQEGITNIVKSLIEVGKLYAIWRLSILAMQIPFGVMKLFSNEHMRMTSTLNLFTSSSARNQRMLSSQVATTNTLVAAIERLNYVTNANTSAFITNAQGVTMANTAANRYINTATVGAANPGNTTSRISGVGSAISSGLMMVGIAWMAADVMAQFGMFGKTQSGRKLSFSDYVGWSDWSQSDEGVVGAMNNENFTGRGIGNFKRQNDILRSKLGEYKDQRLTPIFDDKGNLISMLSAYGGKSGIEVGHEKIKAMLHGNATFKTIDDVLNATNVTKENSAEYEKSVAILEKYGLDPRAKTFGHKKMNPGMDLNKVLGHGKDKASSIRGNSVTTINVNVGGITGMNNPKFEVRNMKDMDNIKNVVGVQMAQILSQAVNDSQIIANK